jgi:hypothetical protein
MSCTNPRGHRWVDRIPDFPSARHLFGERLENINRLLVADPHRRVCVQCTARGRVDSQGKVQLVLAPENPKVQIVPLAQRAKWAQKKTEFDR